MYLFYFDKKKKIGCHILHNMACTDKYVYPLVVIIIISSYNNNSSYFNKKKNLINTIFYLKFIICLIHILT